MNTIKILAEQLLQKDFTVIPLLKDELEEQARSSPIRQIQSFMFHSLIGDWTRRIDSWREHLREDGNTTHQLLERQRTDLRDIVSDFQKSIKALFWDDLNSYESVIMEMREINYILGVAEGTENPDGTYRPHM